MKFRIKHQKPIAAFLLLLMGAQTLLPVTALALTSGPSQPEASSFKQAGVSDMVDPFTGNFSYNLPLLDVDGYPVNLNYNAGSGIDDEASWVGLGWGLNVGAITRQLRGIPDDMNGDIFTTEHYTKPKVTVGGRITAKLEVKGKGTLKNASVNGSLSLGVFSDNYTGIGAELGANAGISYTFAGSGALTANMGAGLMSNTQSGVDVTPSLSLSYKMKVADNNTISPSLSASIGYNTRGGLKGLTLGASYSISGQKLDESTGKVKNGTANYEVGGATISYNTDPISPKIQVPYQSNYGSFSFDIGGLAWWIFTGGGGTGYKSVRQVKSRILTNPGYGFLYAERGKKVSNAMMDFIREKESMVMPELPNLAVPVATPDLFSYTSQGGSGQFRLYRGGSGILFDNQAKDESTTQTLGFDAGIGGYAHGGVTYFDQAVKNVTQKWTGDNAYQKGGDFQDPSTDPNLEHVFFKQVGEKTQEDNVLAGRLQGTKPVAVNISGKSASQQFRLANNSTQSASTLKADKKGKKRIAISYLTALEASQAGLDKQINSYPFITPTTPEFPKECHTLSVKKSYNRFDSGNQNEEDGDGTIIYRKKNHISEITVTDEGGKRSIYGIPVYNAKQVEYSFAIGKPGSSGSRDEVNNLYYFPTGSTAIPQNTDKETDHYFHCDEQPAYATSYLLTGILSPDYVDVTNNGISDDDRGTAIKFNYSKMDGLFNWRSPNKDQSATISKGLLADPDDDKASFVYGKKELWFLHSIETKTQIAYFITDEREDGLGVLNVLGGLHPGKQQRVLKEIRLYSKADKTKPIKIVKLEYAYSLCKNVPNSGASGKLTLKKVYFQYGNSDKGKAHPYMFTYNGETGDGYMTQDVEYGNLQTDRWGTYKSRQSNGDRGVPLRNDEFPYSTQNDIEANKAAGLWQLSNIKLPTGGEINVSYESDDYAYVQNKRAMEMVQPIGLVNGLGSPTTNLTLARGIKVKLSGMPSGIDAGWFKANYLNGSNYLYTKFFVNLGGIDALRDVQNEKYYDFVPCYAKINKVYKDPNATDVAIIIFDEVKDGGVTMGPISHAAWQRLRMEYPRYAYPGYKNRINDNDAGKAIKAAISAIVNAAKNLDELRRNFYKRASDEGYARTVNLAKSVVRIKKFDGKKFGGGHRVRKIQITDNWNTMTGNNARTSTYGQEYSYTTEENGKTISSGVASFEPSVGNDENPLRQPIPYVQNIKGALNNFFNLEEPFGESLFPGAGVGYSKITVRDLTATGDADPEQKTGYVVNEFYTAKEFPTIVEYLSNKVNQHGPSGWYSFIGSYSVHELTFSQGYAITLNDMHGKPKATKIYNKTNDEISSTEYFYNSEPLNAGEFKLKNVVNIVNENGEVTENQVIGREIELFTDMREQETNTNGESINLGIDVVPLPFGIPGPFPHWPYKSNDEYKLFRSACTMKVIQYYGILDKVVKTVDGSSVATENVAYDGVTGETVITKTYNEFEKPVYSINFPAYWIYPSMGGAYKSLGTLIPNLTTNNAGELNDPRYETFLHAGDEIMDVVTGQIYWIIESGKNGATTNITKKMVDRNGNVVLMFNHPAKVLRSGYRNMLTPPATSIVCLQDPVVTIGGKKYVTFATDGDKTDMKVLTASATVFDEEWGVKRACATCPPGYTLTPDRQNCRIPLIENADYCFTLCRGANDHTFYDNGGAIIYDIHDIYKYNGGSFWGGSVPAPPDPPDGFRMARVDSSALKTATISSLGATTLTTSIATDPCTHQDLTPRSECCGRLINAGVWLCTNNTVEHWQPQNEWIAFETCVDIEIEKDYWIGYAADNMIRILIDGNPNPWQVLEEDVTSNHTTWRVKPYHFASGKHKIRVEFLNVRGHAGVAMEIYDSEYEDLIVPGSYVTDGDIIFSTARDLLGKNVQVYRDARGQNIPRYRCMTGQLDDICASSIPQCGTIPVNNQVNPYVSGFRGNWRPYKSKVYQVNRKYDNLFNTEPLGLNLKNAGVLEKFRSFFTNNGAQWNEIQGSEWDTKWVTANTITLYDRYGQELENKDALGRYSAVNFVFRGDQPGAVASNAKNREIYSECFEDFVFRSRCNRADEPNCDPLLKLDGTSNLLITTTEAHSGNYSLEIQNGKIVTLNTTIHDRKTKEETGTNKFSYLTTDNSGQFWVKHALTPNGFEPEYGKKYIFSAWVKDNSPQTNTPGIDVSVNGITVPLTKKAVVEDWKQVEGIIDLTSAANNSSFNISISAAGTVYIDDLRIHPFDSHMKTYAYDDKNFRLMAEMDENNFATFYEYDDEGSLVRLKKETERGIMTIKENRSSYRKAQ